MLESLAAVAAAALLALPSGAPASVAATLTVHREGDTVFLNQQVTIDGQTYSRHHLTMDCSSENRNTICTAMQAIPNATVSVTRTWGDGGEMNVTATARVGDAGTAPWATVTCDSEIRGAVCDVVRALEG